MCSSDLENLKRAAENFKSTLDSDDITKIAEADVAFHDIIYLATDNQRLIQLLNNLREQMYRYRVEYLKQKDCYPQLLAEHQQIIHALENGEKDVATKLTNQHIKNQVSAVSGVIRNK